MMSGEEMGVEEAWVEYSRACYAIMVAESIDDKKAIGARAAKLRHRVETAIRASERAAVLAEVEEALRVVETAHFGQWCAVCLGGEAPAPHMPECVVGQVIARIRNGGQA